MLAIRSSALDRLAPALVIASGVVALVTTAAAAFVNPAIATPGRAAYNGSGVVMTLVDLLLAIGLTGLVLSAAVRPGVLRWVAGALLVAGSFAIVPAEILLRVNFATGNAAFGIAGPVQAVGLILFGIGVIVTGRWTSWRRFAVLAMGLYVPVVMMPALIMSHGDNLAALAGYHLCVVLVGAAYAVESRLRVAG